MEDNYHVDCTLSFVSSNHNDDQFPDTRMEMTFNATDVNIDTMCRQFEILLKGMGYVFDGRHLEMIDGDPT
jgi:azurin